MKELGKRKIVIESVILVLVVIFYDYIMDLIRNVTIVIMPNHIGQIVFYIIAIALPLSAAGLLVASTIKNMLTLKADEHKKNAKWKRIFLAIWIIAACASVVVAIILSLLLR